VVVQLQSGQRPLQVLIQQGSQIASAFGPAGITIATVGSLAVAAGSAFLGLGRDTENATEAAKRFAETQDQLKKLLDDSTIAIRNQAAAISRALRRAA
jgi:trimeric autotransporter adhesin